MAGWSALPPRRARAALSRRLIAAGRRSDDGRRVARRTQPRESAHCAPGAAVDFTASPGRASCGASPPVDSRGVALDVALVRFHGENTAVLRYADAKGRSASDAHWAQEVGFVERHHSGRLLLRGLFAGHYLDVDEGDRVSQRGAGEGAVGAGLLGVLGGPPGIAAGVVLGAIIGAETGRADETEAEPWELADKLRAAIPPSSSAIVLTAKAADVDDMLTALGENAKDVLRRTLTADEEAALQASISTPPPTAP